MADSADCTGERLPNDWRPLRREFFVVPPELVAPKLLGKLLARRTASGWLAGRIVEVEAYLGPHITATPDAAAHSFRGVTERNRVMFGPPGHAYVYFIYGMHFCANVTCEPEGMAGCILLRALEPVLGVAQMAVNRGLKASVGAEQIASGPGKLCRALGISREALNGADLLGEESELRLFEDGFERGEIGSGKRVGIRLAAELPLRFWLAGNGCISRG